MKSEVLNKMQNRFTFGSNESLPFRYVGLNIEEDGDQVIINQDHFVESLVPPDLKEISSVKKEALLSDRYQTEFRSLVSKLNMLSVTSRPDITFEVKLLTTKYGNATKQDLMKAIKLLQKAKRVSTKIVIPDMGDTKDWILVAYSDAATKKIDNAFSVAGHIVFLVNKATNQATTLTWSSKKIERVVNSSLGAETIAMTKLIGTVYFIKEILKQMYGQKGGDIPCLALTDSNNLFEAVHNVKTTQDKRLVGDILQIKQAMAIDNIITELRLVKSSEMYADSLTKGGVNAEHLMNVLRSGTLTIPGDKIVENQISHSTWQKLMKAQSETFGSIHDEFSGDLLEPIIHNLHTNTRPNEQTKPKIISA